MTIFSKWTGSVFNLLAPSASDITDANLVLLNLAKEGDRAAFQQLLEQNYDWIYNVVYRFTGHTEDAEDITQDVCLALADKIKSFRGEARFQTWLYTLIMNTCRDAYRKNKRHKAKLLDYVELEGQLQIKNNNSQRITWLYRQIAKLDEPLRMTAFLVLAENLTHADVGKILGCRESTVSWRMFEARKLLKQWGGQVDE